MHPDVQRSRRRSHSADFKAKVLAQCLEQGASVAAVVLANGLNANLVRKWLVGRGMGRADPLPAGVESRMAQQVMLPAQATSAAPVAAPMQFMQLELPSPSPAQPGQRRDGRRCWCRTGRCGLHPRRVASRRHEPCGALAVVSGAGLRGLAG